MKITSTLNSREQILEFKSLGISEVILECQDFSRLGSWTLAETMELAREIDQAGMRPVLQWDLLQTQNDFAKTCEKIKKCDLSLFSALRVQEMGAMFFSIRELNIPLQLILETAHHNLRAIMEMLDFGVQRIERVILSQELEARTLKKFIDSIQQRNIETELLVLGPILLFYTPRKLLGQHYEDEFDSLKSLATSEESPHSGFTVVENRHGTFMFHTKDHALFDQVEIIRDLKLDWGRFEGRSFNDLNLEQQCLILLKSCFVNSNPQDVLDLKALYPKKLFRGFFGVNKTDVLFSKLKNTRIARADEAYLGEVLDSDKDQYVAISLKAQNKVLSLGDTLRLITPEGRERTLTIKKMRNSRGQDVSTLPSGQIAILPWSGGIVRKTIVYRD
jgi:U32 family peptidase